MNEHDLMPSPLKDAYDLHVHCSPDVVPRSQSFLEVAQAAHDAGMAGVGLKDHTTSTVDRCFALNRLFPNGPRFFSSIALNAPLGGLNPAAVEAALANGVDIVYFPTYCAAHHIDTWGGDVTPVPHPQSGIVRISVLDQHGGLNAEAREIVELIVSNDAVLATGHLSPRESLALLNQAASIGAKRMVVTHASQSVPGMSIDDQRRAVQIGAMIEHSFLAVTNCCPGSVSIEAIAEQIRAVGHQHIVLSSDFGQVDIGPPVEGFSQHVERLAALDFGEDELRTMLCDNPRRLVEERKRGSR